MLEFLLAEHGQIQKSLSKTLGPSQLFTGAGEKIIRKEGSKTLYGMVLIMLPADTEPYYSNTAFDVLLGYPSGKGPSINPKLFGRMLGSSHCYSELDKLNRHFNATPQMDYEGIVQLQCNDGSLIPLVYIAHRLCSFDESEPGILLLFTTLKAISAAKVQLPAGVTKAETEKFYALYISMSVNAQLTMHYLGSGNKAKELKTHLCLGRKAIDGYTREIKNHFKVESLTAIAYQYSLFSHLCTTRLLKVA